MASSQQHRCVFVGNIPYDATEEQLIQICEEVGPVVSFRLVIDRETGKPKGYGFCEYKDEETALSARRNLQGYEINGRQLRVDFAENDKGADRSREQGRGGPGLATNTDAQKQVGGPAVIGDSQFHQPIGLPLSMTAASVMAGALGGPQSGQINQNGLQNQSPVGNDPLTHHLAKMSKSQLSQALHDMKIIAMQNKDLARQLLVANPQLSKALFQAQIILGMVKPQMLQMPNIRQQAPNPAIPKPQPSMQLTMQGHPPVQNLPGLPSFTPISTVSHNHMVNNQFSVPVPLHPQLRAQHPNQNQMVGAVPEHSGLSSLPSARPHSLGALQMPPVSSSSFRPFQAPSMQPAGVGTTITQNANLQPTFQSHSTSSDSGYQVVSSVRPASIEATVKDTLVRPPTVRDATLAAGTNTLTNTTSLNRRDSQIRPSKFNKLDDGKGVPFSSAGLAASSTNEIAGSSGVAGQNSNFEAPNTENQTPQVNLFLSRHL
ncbi:unnamed protein product [Amaranthus hypochondriacus]